MKTWEDIVKECEVEQKKGKYAPFIIVHPERVAQSISKHHAQLMIKELKKAKLKVITHPISWSQGKATNWRTEWETIARHTERMDKRISEYKEGKNGTNK